MRPRAILLGWTAALVPSVLAQNNNNNNDDDGDNNNNNNQDQTTIDDDDNSTSSAKDDPSSTTTDDAKPTESLPDIDEASSTTTTTSSSSSPSATTTTATRATDSVPAITSDTGDTPPLPTLPGSYSYPPPAVPPTKNAPFMQKSNLPQGTVFIAVGAILGAFAVAILIWRIVVGCLLHRSVKRATLAQQVANDKSAYPPSSAPLYKYSDHASSLSLGTAPATRGARKSRPPVPSSTPSQTNLFFSPTAPAGAGTPGNRESRFLPSGFYASGAGSPQQGNGHAISMTNLRPDSHGHGSARGVEPSPPETPNLAPPRDVGRRNASSSTLNLNRPASGRAPSAYLEDLLTDQPEQFPPPGGFHGTYQPSNRF
ncbi:hypothetical protein F4808DRAFT_426076 [Astrocystis sublimbata]|nr:hypothetical protein F4808DRAFT_426076 [Astrocystis sublimbata]